MIAPDEDDDKWQSRLTRAVASWLSYKSLVGMDGLLKESSLSVPIAEFLSRNLDYKIEGEIEHPDFKKPAQRGRPRQLDFVAKSEKKKVEWVFVLETKSLPLSKQGFVDDILRLVLLTKTNVGRYLLVAGELTSSEWTSLKQERKRARGNIRGSIRVPFKLMANRQGKTRSDLLRSFVRDDYAEKIINLEKNVDLRKRYLKSFQSRYAQNSLPKNFATKLVSWNRKNRFVAVLWSVSRRPGSTAVSYLE